MNKKIIIYIFGNPLLDFDSLPIKLLPELRKQFKNIDFQVVDPNENLKPLNQELIIIDSAQGVDDVIIINNIDKLQINPIYSAHDFDLTYNLKLLQKLDALKKITIFCLPMNMEKDIAIKKLVKQINLFLNDQI